MTRVRPIVALLVMTLSFIIGATVYLIAEHRVRTTPAHPPGATRATARPLVEIAPVAPLVPAPPPEESATPAPLTMGDATTVSSSTPFSCDDFDKVTLTGVSLTTEDKPAVTAKGFCELHLVNVRLKAPTALQVEDQATVTADDSTLEGSQYAIDASGITHVTLHTTTVKGAVRTKSLAKIDEID